MRPVSATAAEKSASISAAERASMAIQKFRQPARSRVRHMRAKKDSFSAGIFAELTGSLGSRYSLGMAMLAASLDWNASGFENFAENRFGLLGFFLRGDVTRADHHAMREDGNDQPFEIVGQAIIASFEERAGLRAAMEHHGAARAYSETQLLGLPRTLHNFERVIEQAVFHFHVRNGFLHRDHVRRIHFRRHFFHLAHARMVSEI